MWEGLKAISAFLAATIIPITIAITGHVFSKAIKERELQGKFVELAVDILKSEPTADNRNIRKWATQVIDKYSGIPLGADASRELIETTRITEPRP